MTEILATACYCGTCDDCAGTLPRPPVADPVAYRHGAIRQRMLARIGGIRIDGVRPLDALGTRDGDDPAIALIDAYAGSLHILAWNIARLADDGTIGRTEDRDALVDLTRLLGYEPRPALAATTTLAFTLDTIAGAPGVARIPRGTKVASVPGQDEKPQTFETSANLDARAEWNALRAVQTPAANPIAQTTATIVLAGVSLNARIGDFALVYLEPQPVPAKWLCSRITAIQRRPELDPPRTEVALTDQRLLVCTPEQQGPAFTNSVVILGERAAAFGATAPDLQLMSDDVRKGQLASGAPSSPLPTEWRDLAMPVGQATGGNVDLDAVHPDAMADHFVIFERGDTGASSRALGRITASAERGRRGFGLSAKVTRITVAGIDLTAGSTFQAHVRDTSIFIETARERLLVRDADVALPAGVGDRLLVTGGADFPVGRRVVLTGRQWAGAADADVGEVATVLSATSMAGGTTELIFERAVASRFHATTLSVLGNCVAASHGETPASGADMIGLGTAGSGAEPIGSGSAANPAPRFRLKGSPLTYVPALNARGYAPAIEMRVDDRRYDEHPTLFGLDSEDRAFAVRPVRGGASDVQFAGRLPSGLHNVTALYRTGGGTAGNMAAGRITMALAPVIGVGKVSNPVAAEGGSDAESIDDLRTAAPQSIRTLDRVVSLADFAAYARAYRGIGKALATELHDGMRSVVSLTIATTTLLPPGTDTIDALRAAIALVCVPGRRIRIDGFTDLTDTVNLTIAIAVDPAFRRSAVEAAARAALGARFGRARQSFGEALHRSAIVAAVQAVDGVVAATLPVFSLTGGPPEDEGRLPCPAPTLTAAGFTPAGLLAIDPARVAFAEMLS